MSKLFDDLVAVLGAILLGIMLASIVQWWVFDHAVYTRQIEFLGAVSGLAVLSVYWFAIAKDK